MNLGELKKSLARFPPDMDDTEILIHYVDEKGELDVDCMAFVAVVTLRDNTAIALGTWKAADDMRKKYPERFPKDYKSRPEIKPKNTETNEE